MINRDQVRAGTHEYTGHCGWVDWTHAGGWEPGMIRPDVVRLWSQFPHAIRPNQRSNPRPSPGGNGYLVTHISDADPLIRYERQVAASPLTPLNPLAVECLPRDLQGHGLRPRVWFIPLAGLNETRSREIALAIYRIACEDVERGQTIHNFISHSTFAFEDLVSNLIAFYRHIIGYTLGDIRRIAGGVVQGDDLRRDLSRYVLNAMDGAGVRQQVLQSRHWDRAYLFNDLLPPQLISALRRQNSQAIREAVQALPQLERTVDIPERPGVSVADGPPVILESSRAITIPPPPELRGGGTRGFVLLPPELHAINLIEPGQNPGDGLFWSYDPANPRQRELDRPTGRR